MDETPGETEARDLLKNIFLEGKWYEVYDLLEFTIQSPKMGNKGRLTQAVSAVLEQEMAGFRLIADEFVEVTDETEIAAIEEALEATADEFKNARAHLSSALRLLSDRKDPDYRNSVKESISAVEAVVQSLTGDPHAELGKAMRLLEREAPVHGAFAAALRSLYGYTSDADGIRHALIEAPNLDAPTAKFMLVVCSAFVVYLIQQVPRHDS